MARASSTVCAERRFAIDVLPRLQRRDDDVFVLMRAGGDDDGLDFFVGKDGLVILHLRRVGSFAGATAHHGRITIANGRDVRLLQPAQLVENFPSPWPEADDRNFDLRLGASVLILRSGSAGHQLHPPIIVISAGEGTAFEKIAAVAVNAAGVRLVHAGK